MGLGGNYSSHSFRKMYASEIYNENGHDIELVRVLLQHSSAVTTQRYIGIRPDQIESAIAKTVKNII